MFSEEVKAYAVENGIPAEPISGWWNWETQTVFAFLSAYEGVWNDAMELGADELERAVLASWPDALFKSFKTYKGDRTLINWAEVKESL